ncbi:MAG: tetratricopeptide repeat protein [Pseudomonadota bacterium]
MIAKTAPYALRHAIGNVFMRAAVAALLFTAQAHADELGEVSALLRAGKASEALAKTNEFLAKHPADPQMRFMKGVLLTEQNKSDEAIAVFTKLTEDYKDLPEPYNNLAVLYAANGQYEKARIALEKAIRTNPSYMTAYENLGDVYGKMASQAYDKALALGNATPSKSKLTLLRTFSSSTGSKISAAEVPAPAPASAASAHASVKLISPIPEAPKNVPMQRIPSMAVTPPAAPPTVIAKVDTPKPAAAPAIAPSAAKVAPVAPTPSAPVLARVAPPAAAPAAPSVVKRAVPAPVPAAPLPAAPAVAKAAVPPPVAATPAKPAAPAPAAPVVAKVEAPKAAPAPVAAKPAADHADRDEVLGRVSGWAKAWSSQDVDGYLGYYSNDFVPPKGLSRQAWAQERRARIAGKGRIHVAVTAPQVVINGDTARVSFRQTYESDRLSTNSRKTLVMVKQGNKWQIKQETSGS